MDTDNVIPIARRRGTEFIDTSRWTVEQGTVIDPGSTDSRSRFAVHGERDIVAHCGACG